MGFAGMVGSCSVVQAELWEIYHGLHIIKEHFLQAYIFNESNSAEAVKFLNKGCSRNQPCYSLVNLIVRTAADFHKLECNHVLREANQVADRFAKEGSSIPSKIKIFHAPPIWGHFFFVCRQVHCTFPSWF
uniref:Ribonuclease H protein At1g65750 family n=1 Tax=Cajanus cajan TaxID=3821 RepID=A0A151QU29_CAJCA|nr:Putative ribonuclease H protein At1g65750 family [Cajanus cajan]